MRLPPDAPAEIARAVTRHFGPAARVYLFGSRTDDCKRGGDVDLYVETPGFPGGSRWFCTGLLLQDLERILGERRIDLVVRGPDDRRGLLDAEVLRTGVPL